MDFWEIVSEGSEEDDVANLGAVENARCRGVVQGKAVARLHYWARDPGAPSVGSVPGVDCDGAGAGLWQLRRACGLGDGAVLGPARQTMDVQASAVDWRTSLVGFVFVVCRGGRHFVAEAATVGGFRHRPLAVLRNSPDTG